MELRSMVEEAKGYAGEEKQMSWYWQKLTWPNLCKKLCTSNICHCGNVEFVVYSIIRQEHVLLRNRKYIVWNPPRLVFPEYQANRFYRLLFFVWSSCREDQFPVFTYYLVELKWGIFQFVFLSIIYNGNTKKKKKKRKATRVAFPTLILAVLLHWKIAVDRFLSGHPIGMHFRLHTRTRQI